MHPSQPALLAFPEPRPVISHRIGFHRDSLLWDQFDLNLIRQLEVCHVWKERGREEEGRENEREERMERKGEEREARRDEKKRKTEVKGRAGKHKQFFSWIQLYLGRLLPTAQL